jgi:hypothetical protein
MLNVVPGSRQRGERRQEQAFVFAAGAYQGTDTKEPSTSLTVRQDSDVEATVTYRTYAAGGTDQPTGAVEVRYRWNGTAFVPLDQIPPADPAVPNHR